VIPSPRTLSRQIFGNAITLRKKQGIAHWNAFR
jgi:hypothetical protein